MATDLLQLWTNIANAGGVQNYINQQLRERGFLVERKDTSSMGDAEKSRYKQQLKDEAAEAKKLRAEARKAYKATHLVHLGEGPYWTDEPELDLFDLPDAEERAAENGLPKLDSVKELAEALGVSVAELRWLAFHREAATRIHYQRFEIPKADGSKRAIWAPHRKLKRIQRWILRNVLERLPVHGASHGFLAGRSIVTNAEMHRDAAVVVNMDLKDFFPSITWRRVKGVFRKAGYRDGVSTLLALLCTEAPREVMQHEGKTLFLALGPRCLPQGAPTSPAITNALSLRLDRRLSGLARKLGWRYTRYADDLTFSLPSGHKGRPAVGKLLGSVARVVEAENFTLHPDKTSVSRTGARQEVTGLVVNGDRGPRVPREVRRRLRAALHNLKAGKPLRPGESVETLMGWASFIHQADPVEGKRWLEAVAAVKG